MYSKNLDEVLNQILGDKRHRLKFCWDQSHCTKIHLKLYEYGEKALYLKQFKRVWKHFNEYNRSNTLLVNYTPLKALLNL